MYIVHVFANKIITIQKYYTSKFNNGDIPKNRLTLIRSHHPAEGRPIYKNDK